MSRSENGTLYVVSTPIGNLKDLSFRALDVLRSVNCIVCEDTRVTLKLLNSYAIKKPLLSYHSKSRDSVIRGIEKRIMSGKDVALVTDSGTPCISDPGSKLISSVLNAGIPVVPVPGPSAVHTAIMASGLSFAEYIFMGFLSSKPVRRRRKLEELKDNRIVFVFYESPHRILSFLNDVTEVFGEVKVLVAKEMTKRYERYYRGSSSDVTQEIRRDGVRGEYTIVIDNRVNPRI
jgi:16S rRNA (cytidine1402-2'-O)-methyltransferase